MIETYPLVADDIRVGRLVHLLPQVRLRPKDIFAEYGFGPKWTSEQNAALGSVLKSEHWKADGKSLLKSAPRSFAQIAAKVRISPFVPII